MSVSIGNYVPGDNLSGGGLSKQEMGQVSWIVLHAAAAAFALDANGKHRKATAEETRWFHLLLQSLAHIYPCGICRLHYRTLLLPSMPPTDNFQSSRDAQTWLSNAHNAVNKRVGNKLHPYSDAKAEEMGGGRCANDDFGSTTRIETRVVHHPPPQTADEELFGSDSEDSGETLPWYTYGANLTETRVSKEQVGRATWLLLHSVAAAYPSRPSRDEKMWARRFVVALAHLYPCKECKQTFLDLVRPIDFTASANATTMSVAKESNRIFENKQSFISWASESHSLVNAMLGKLPYVSVGSALLERTFQCLGEKP